MNCLVPLTIMALRLRSATIAAACAGLIAVQLAVGALFPAVGHSIGRLRVPDSVAALLGGANYGTIGGWFQSEIGAIYGPLLAGGLAIVFATGATAGEEEDGILGLVLAYPVPRALLIVAKAMAMALATLAICAALLVGMVAGVALGGGGISLTHIAALALTLFLFATASGAVALAAAGGAGRRGLATGIGVGVLVAGWLVNGFLPFIGGVGWLRYLVPFHYLAGHAPLLHGADAGDLVVLGLLALVLIATAAAAISRRDLRG